MKIYFAGSIRGGRDDLKIYQKIISLLGEYGQVLTEHIGLESLDVIGEERMTDQQIYNRDMAWLQSADVVVAEVTTASLGVGYELGQAEALGIPVICLYRQQDGKRLSAMVLGNDYFAIVNYVDVSDLASTLKEILKTV